MGGWWFDSHQPCFMLYCLLYWCISFKVSLCVGDFWVSARFVDFHPPRIPPVLQRCYGGWWLVGALPSSSSLHGAATPLACLGSSGSSVVVICLPRTELAFCVTVPPGEGRQTAARQGRPVTIRTVQATSRRGQWHWQTEVGIHEKTQKWRWTLKNV